MPGASLRRVVLLGSYARGRQTVASDGDLLVVYSGAVRDDAYALVCRTLGISRLEPHVYAEVEYAQIRATLERMVQDGITVYSAALERVGLRHHSVKPWGPG